MKSSAHGVRRGAASRDRRAAPSTRARSTRRKNAVADLAGAGAPRRRDRSAARPPRGSAAPASSRRAGRTSRRSRRDAAADHHEVLRHGARSDLAQAALEADRRDVMLAAAVRAAADLDVAAAAAATRSGPLAQVIAEQAAEAARLRHRELARLGARAARHVGDRVGVARPRPAAASAAIELRARRAVGTQRKTRF